MPRLVVAAAALVACAVAASAQSPRARVALDSVPDLTLLVTRPASELADVVDRFSSDLGSLRRRYDADGSPEQRGRMREFYHGWRTRLASLDFDALGEEGRADYVLLDNYLKHQLVLLDRAGLPPCRHGAAHSIRRSAARPAGCTARPEDGQFSRRRQHARRRDEAGRQPARALRRTRFAKQRQLGQATSRCTQGLSYRRESRRRPARRHPRRSRQLVQLLRRLRPAVHLVEQGSLQASRFDAHPLRAHTARARRGIQAGGGAGRHASPPVLAAAARMRNLGPIIGDPIGAKGLTADLALRDDLRTRRRS